MAKNKSTKGQTAQWPKTKYKRTDSTMAKNKVQEDKQRSTKHTHKTKT